MLQKVTILLKVSQLEAHFWIFIMVLTLDIPYGPVSAKVNNKVEGLNYRAYNNKDVEFLNILSSSGMRTYVRSLCFVLCKAVEDLYPDGKHRAGASRLQRILL